MFSLSTVSFLIFWALVFSSSDSILLVHYFTLILSVLLSRLFLPSFSRFFSACFKSVSFSRFRVFLYLEVPLLLFFTSWLKSALSKLFNSTVCLSFFLDFPPFTFYSIFAFYYIPLASHSSLPNIFFYSTLFCSFFFFCFFLNLGVSWSSTIFLSFCPDSNMHYFIILHYIYVSSATHLFIVWLSFECFFM